ncbi:hypothetical protein BCR42DRAFT_338541 [Absidia repens]|uniref:Uncharacterized protein n=1 Tax=Absidia repens TaxID=90262 RepID=A0A1X2HXK6_9FUNG|nr:hypothetical protein BCR42DRAFT_338541 [Absidia repens]
MNSLKLFSLKGKKAIVTGGERGLGLEMCKALAGAGADIAMTYILSDTGAHATAATIAKEAKVQCKAYKAEMRSNDQVNAAMDQIYTEFGKVDILVANAGVVIGGPTKTFTMDDWKHIFEVNVQGTFSCVQAVGSRMLEQGQGSIILMSSAAGSVATRPQPQCAYGASKGAITTMTKCLASEWATRGVRVNSINPGYMMTEMVKEAGPEMFRQWEAYTPMGRLGNPDELNGAVVFLASDASSYMTGAQLFIDGGYTCV